MSNINSDILKIIECGHAAPSADNFQPWFFRIKNNSIFVYHDKTNSKSTNIYNINYFVDYIGIGAVIENIEIASVGLGYLTKTTYCQTGELIAVIKFTKNRISSQPLLDFIFKRHTNRKRYVRKSIPDDIKETMEKISREKGGEIFLMENRENIDKFSKIVSLHDLVLWENESLRKIIIDKINLKDGENKKDGLSISSLELGWKKNIFWLSFITANYFKFIWKIIAKNSKRNTMDKIKNSGAICFLVMPGAINRENCVNAGRILENLWLYLTSKNISLQPLFGYFDIVLNKIFNIGGLSKKHEKIKDKIMDYFNNNFTNRGNPIPLAIFRIGYSQPPTAVAPRKDLRKVIKL